MEEGGDFITGTATAILSTEEGSTSANEGLPLEQIIYLCLYYSGLGILLLIAVCGNMLVIVSIVTRDTLKVPTNCFLLSLATSDFLGSISYAIYQIGHIDMPHVLKALGSWGQCTTIITVVGGLQMVSSYSLVAETTVRFIAVKYPIYYRQHMSWGKVGACAAAIWLTGIVIALAMYLRVESPSAYSGMCRFELWLGIGHISALLVISFFIPLIAMLALYSHIAHLLRRQVKKITVEQHVSSITDESSTNSAPAASNTKPRTTKNELKLVTTAAILLAYFIVSWAPFIIYAYVAMLCSTCTISPYVRLVVRLLLYSNMSVNVFIYAGRSPIFRKAFRSDLRRVLCLSR